jgi:hypothetical protein
MAYEVPEPEQPQGLSTGAIVAIVLGCVGGALVLGGLILALLLFPALSRAREEARRIRCRSNLKQLGTGMAGYLNIHGEGRFYPWPSGRRGCGGSRQDASFGGAEWLASLYWTKTLTDPGIYICPSSQDSNSNGEALGTFQCPSDEGLSKHAVSYAGMAATSYAVYEREKLGRSPSSKSAIGDQFPSNEPMACDDTDDPINHGERDNGGMSILFFDTHADFWTHTRVDLNNGVGNGDLVALRN